MRRRLCVHPAVFVPALFLGCAAPPAAPVTVVVQSGGGVFRLPAVGSVETTVVLRGTERGTVSAHNGNDRLAGVLVTRVDPDGILFSRRFVGAGETDTGPEVLVQAGWTIRVAVDVYKDIAGAVHACVAQFDSQCAIAFEAQGDFVLQP